MDPEENASPGKVAWYHINKTYLPMKAGYLLFFAALGCLLPFIPVYASQLGFSASEIGLMYGIYPFLAIIPLPIVGAIADKFQRHKELMILCIVCWAVFCELMLLVPSRTRKLTTNIDTYIHCESNSYISDCDFSERDPRALKCQFGDYISTAYMNGTANKPNVCEVSCEGVGTNAQNTEVSVCFSNASMEHAEECYDFRHQSEKQNLMFSMQNIYDLTPINNTYDERYGLANTSQLRCLKYDLTNLVYQNQNFRNLFCEEHLTFKCLLSCNEIVMESCTENVTTSYDAVFWIFLICFLFGHIGITPAITILEAVSYNILGENRYKWGKQRLFGTVSFAVCAVSSSFIMDSLKKTQQGVDYSVSFYIFGGLCFLACIAGYCLNIPKDFKCSGYVKNVCRLLKNPEFVVFLCVTFCFGCLSAGISTFLFLFLDGLGATKLVLGLNVVVETCIAEAPMLFVSGTIIKKLGHLSCLYITCVAYFVRFLGYSLLTNPWYALLLAPLHGVTFGLFWATCTSHVSVIAPKDITASAQGMISGIHWGIGKGIGSIVAGLMFDKLGTRWTFRVLAIFAAFLLVFYVSMNKFFFKSHKHREAEKENTDDSSQTVEGEKLANTTGEGNRHLEPTSKLLRGIEATTTELTEFKRQEHTSDL